VTQRECKPAETMSHKVEVELARLLQLELNFLETFEGMKLVLE